MNECFPDKARIARDIIAYLSTHQDAQDTLDGIIQWWQRERKSDQHITLLKEVLGDLVTQGLIEKGQKAGQTHYYRIHPKHKIT
jgi:hypothetical protein